MASFKNLILIPLKLYFLISILMFNRFVFTLLILFWKHNIKQSLNY